MILALYVAFGAVVGGVVGSYATTWALRATDETAPQGARSRCDGCHRVLNWRETMPVLSYVAARGACRSCTAAISPYHPIGEGLGIALGAAIAWAAPDLRVIPLGVIAACLLAASIYDLRTLKLPRLTTGLVALASAVLAAWHGVENLIVGLVAAAATLIIIKSASVLFQYQKGKVGFGAGDIWLMASLALWLGVATPAAIAVFCAIVIGVGVVRRRVNTPIPTGPAIAIAGFSIGLLLEAGIWPRP